MNQLGPTCRCGDPIEEVDNAAIGYNTHWAHVRRMSVEYDHPAAPAQESTPADPTGSAACDHVERNAATGHCVDCGAPGDPCACAHCRRADLIAGLRELADFYEQHPDMPLPPYPDFRHCVLSNDDDAGVAEVTTVAAQLGVELYDLDDRPSADRKFGSITFSAFYVRRVHARRWVEGQKTLGDIRAGKAKLVPVVDTRAEQVTR